ncbi:hypothetical protein GCM10009569_20380 [Arthrobacter russicus]
MVDEPGDVMTDGVILDGRALSSASPIGERGRANCLSLVVVARKSGLLRRIGAERPDLIR